MGPWRLRGKCIETIKLMQSLCVCALKDVMTRLPKYPTFSFNSVFQSKYCICWTYHAFQFFFFIILQPPPAQTMVQALELLYALGGKKQGCQHSGIVKRETVLQLQD